MTRPVHFEIHAADPGRARAFYETLFGWKFQSWGEVEYWVITTGEDGPGINGGLLPRRGPEPAADAAVNGYVLTVGVEDIDVTLKTALGAGATVALEKDTVPGVGQLAYLKDTEGNIFGVLQPA
jgi:predicted enzyme related to lactoylglutathione lyase